MTEILVGVIFSAVLGAILGSFANVLILRWHEAAPITGRSRCPHCRTTIRPRHLVPVLSWIILRGKCAECHRRIHIQYPLVEVVSAFLAVAAALYAPPFSPSNPLEYWFLMLLFVGLVVPVVMDLRWKELPVEYLAALGVCLCVMRYSMSYAAGLADPFMVIRHDLGGLLIVLAFFGLQYLFSGGKWLGSGDILFGVFMALTLGWPNVLVGVYLAYIFGGLTAAIGLVFGLLHRHDRLPFAPSLALGTVLAYLYGEQIIKFAFGYV